MTTAFDPDSSRFVAWIIGDGGLRELVARDSSLGGAGVPADLVADLDPSGRHLVLFTGSVASDVAQFCAIVKMTDGERHAIFFRALKGTMDQLPATTVSFKTQAWAVVQGHDFMENTAFVREALAEIERLTETDPESAPE